MNNFLYNFFHETTNDRTENGLVNIPQDKSKAPESWKRIFFKQYSLFKEIPLPQEKGIFLENVLRHRRSSEGYIKSNVMHLPDLAYILHCGYGLQESGEEQRAENRMVPSAGQRYPLEVYIFLFKPLDTLVSGIYHYGIRRHVLEPVALADIKEKDIHGFVPDLPWLQKSNGMICITSVFSRTTDKYGSRGYRYILLEAGHVAQNMLLAGTEKGINIVPIGGIEAHEIERKIGLSSSEEGIVYTLFF